MSSKDINDERKGLLHQKSEINEQLRSVLSQIKDDKVIVFKKKRRKGYKVKNGHRQQMTKILIKDIK